MDEPTWQKMWNTAKGVSTFTNALFRDKVGDVAALGGNVGNQAVTVTVRKLALGQIDWQNASRRQWPYGHQTPSAKLSYW